MRVPQVSERIKEAPAQALRGVFAGIGQLLMITDKLRHKAPAYHSVPPTRLPEPSETVTEMTITEPAAPREEAAAPAPAQPTAAEGTPAPAPAPELVKPPKPRDFDKTGNVRLLDDEENPAAAEIPAAAASPATAEVPATAAESEVPATGLPLANYDELSVASLRARLRNLDVAQLGQLIEYERAHEARAELIVMFERRIAKLEAEG